MLIVSVAQCYMIMGIKLDQFKQLTTVLFEDGQL